MKKKVIFLATNVYACWKKRDKNVNYNYFYTIFEW